MTGNLWKVSDLLDETDIRFAQKHFFDLRSGYEYYGLTEKVLMRMAIPFNHPMFNQTADGKGEPYKVILKYVQ